MNHPETATATDPALGRRIEEWIVHTIDDRAKPQDADRDWQGELERFSLAKKVARPSDQPAASPTKPVGGWSRFRVARRRGGVMVVTLSDEELTREADVLELAGDFVALVEAGHRRLVVDFQFVERMSSWSANSLAEVFKFAADVEGGAVKVAGLRADVASMFAMTGLDARVSVCPDAASATSGEWPERPDLRPLPVSILAALLRSGGAKREPNPDYEGRPMPTTTLRLIVQDGPMMGRSVAVKGSTFLIGRASSCHLRVASAMVSRSHAMIERRGNQIVLRDLASTNGTRLNGLPLDRAEVEVRDGDRITVGPMEFALAVGVEKAAEAHPSRGIRLASPLEASESDETLDFEVIGEHGLKHDVVEGVLVVTPLTAKLDAEDDINALRVGLLELFDRAVPKRVVVSLAHVVHLSSRAIGLLVAHHMRLDRVGGALRVCLANPRVAVLLEQVQLGMLVDCHQSVDDAIISTWPEGSEVAAALG